EGSPGGLASATVVERAAALRGVVAEPGDQVLAAARRALDGGRRHGGDAAVERRAGLVGPLFAAALDFNEGQAVDGQFLVDFGGGPGQGGRAAVGVDEEGAELLVGGGFVVHGQDAAAVEAVGWLARSVQAEPLHAVVVVARTLIESGVGAIV